MTSLFESLPWYVQDTLISNEYEEFLTNVQMEFGFTNEQKKVLDKKVVMPLFTTKGETAKDLVGEIQLLFKFTEEQAKKCAQLISANTLLVFPQYFGDKTEFHTSIGGNPEQDLYESFTYKLITESFFSGFLGYLQGALDFDPDQEARDMRSFFEREIIDFLYVSDDNGVLKKLNTTLILLLGSVQNVYEQFVHALSQNHQWLGAEKILLDGKEVEPTAANWIKSFLGEMNGEVSTISIPKYLSSSKNTKNLADMDRNALVKLLETFRVLHTFPRSFENLDPEQWMVIPYKQEEKPLTHTVANQLDSSSVGQLDSKKDEKFPPKADQPLAEKIKNEELIISKKEPQLTQIAVNSLSPKPYPLNPSSHMPLTTDIFTLADAIIKEAGVNATNKERFQKLLASYLNNLRNELDTKERLRAPDNEGGIGLSQEDTDKVMKKAKETYSKLHSSQLVSQSAKQHDDINEDIQPLPLTAHRSATSDAFGRSRIKQGDSSQLSVVSNIKSQIPNPKLQINTNNQNSKQEQQPLPTKDVPHNLPVVSEEKPLLVIEDVDGLPTLIQKSVTGNQKPVTSTKSQIPNDKLQINTNDQNAKQQTKKLPTTNYQLPTTIQGIPLKVNVGIPGSPQKDSSAIAGVKRPQVLDPIEELRAMTLQDFRRLSQDPKEAAQKIYQKIMLLEKESFTKKTAGLEGWRDNEVNKLYLQMGRESFGKGVSMNEVIQQRKTAGKDFLVEPEFDALLELNGLLRS